jgi:hypothetical protein
MRSVMKYYGGFNMTGIKMAKRDVRLNHDACDHTSLFLEVTLKPDALYHVE